jgi:hypothetical protein
MWNSVNSEINAEAYGKILERIHPLRFDDPVAAVLCAAAITGSNEDYDDFISFASLVGDVAEYAYSSLTLAMCPLHPMEIRFEPKPNECFKLAAMMAIVGMSTRDRALMCVALAECDVTEIIKDFEV